MSVNHESTPYDGDPDDFDLITDGLLDHIEDPYLVSIHREALQYQELLYTPGVANTQITRRNIVDKLDAQWHYYGKTLTIIGKLWEKPRGSAVMVTRDCIDEEVISQGFGFFKNTSSDATDTRFKIGHRVEIHAKDGSGLVHQAIICIDDLTHMELPTPSPEKRERRFWYHFPEAAAAIDEMNFTAERDDQVIPAFREFYFDVDFDNPEDVEHMKDAAEYLRTRADIEPLVNYRISVSNQMIVLDGVNTGAAVELPKPYTRTMRVTGVRLRPTDIRADADKGKQRCSVYVEATSFEADGTDLSLLIPCSSILSMHSLRFEGTP